MKINLNQWKIIAKLNPWKIISTREKITNTKNKPLGTLQDGGLAKNPNHQKPMTHPRIQFFVISNKGLEGLG